MKTLVLANQKGGVGKSAVASLLTYYFVAHGKRVLAIDLDHQGNFTKPVTLSGRGVVGPFTSDQIFVAHDLALPKERFAIERHPNLMIRMGSDNQLARIPKRAAIAEAQAEGVLLWEVKGPSARDAWADIKPSIEHIAGIVTAAEAIHAL
jgi:cellulose biosynthesis protein BcsQ